MCSWMFSSGSSFPMMFGGIMMLLIWGLVVGAIVYAVRKLSHGRTLAHQDHQNPLRILQERYAKGEIDSDEYKERLQGLTK